MHELYSDFNVINFPAGNSGVQMGGWFKNEVRSLNDLKGLKMRIPGLGGEVMSRLGVNVQVLPGGEVYLALDRGAIDAAEWVGPYDDQKLGLNKAASLYYYPGWWEPGSTFEVQINRSQWDKLPVEYQEIIKTAAIEANTNMLAQYDALNGEALQELIASGTKLTPYSQDILQAAQNAAIDLYQENASTSPEFQKIYQQWSNFRSLVTQWNQVNELSYSTFTSQSEKVT